MSDGQSVVGGGREGGEGGGGVRELVMLDWWGSPWGFPLELERRGLGSPYDAMGEGREVLFGQGHGMPYCTHQEVTSPTKRYFTTCVIHVV